MTKEEKREYHRKRYKADKEKLSVYRKAYYQANKELEQANNKAWRENNKEKVSAIGRDWTDAKKHEPVVYYLPEHHYVGVTDCLYTRLKNHRNNSNRVTEGYEIIYNAKDMTEARAVERYMHYEMGYNGKHGGTKGY